MDVPSTLESSAQDYQQPFLWFVSTLIPIKLLPTGKEKTQELTEDENRAQSALSSQTMAPTPCSGII
jgi:hypothetical protein